MDHPEPTFHVESAGATLKCLPRLILEIIASEIDGGRTLVAYSTLCICIFGIIFTAYPIASICYGHAQLTECSLNMKFLFVNADD